MPWLLASPGHQHPWYWLGRIGKFLSYTKEDFNCLCHVNVEECHKYAIVPPNNVARKGFRLWRSASTLEPQEMVCFQTITWTKDYSLSVWIRNKFRQNAFGTHSVVGISPLRAQSEIKYENRFSLFGRWTTESSLIMSVSWDQCFIIITTSVTTWDHFTNTG